MVAQDTTSQVQAPQVRFPRRFRETESVNRRLGWALRMLIRDGEPDPAMVDAIGRRLMARDEVGAALARAMRSKGPDRVTMAQFNRALADGVDDDAPRPLRDFFALVDAVPDWVDFELVNEGGRVSRRFGRNAADVLLQLA
jgi:hypothetical protein